jgi:hypothetical protein
MADLSPNLLLNNLLGPVPFGESYWTMGLVSYSDQIGSYLPARPFVG